MARYRSNDPRRELKPLLRKWDGNPAVRRASDAPHIKTYMRYREIAGETGVFERRHRKLQCACHVLQLF